jgi:hypothetical protein
VTVRCYQRFESVGGIETLYVGFFAFLIGNFNGLAKMVFNSFSGLDLKAAGSSLSAGQFLQPGRLAQVGIDAGNNPEPSGQDAWLAKGAGRCAAVGTRAIRPTWHWLIDGPGSGPGPRMTICMEIRYISVRYHQPSLAPSPND